MTTQQQDTAGMAVAWSERAKAALDLSRQYLAGAEAVIEQTAPVNDHLFDGTTREVYKHLLAIANLYELRADDCREMAHGCRTVKPDAAAHYTEQARLAQQQERRQRYDAAPGVYSAAQVETFGGRSYDIPKCPHGCCADSVCEFVGDCDSHQAAS